MKTSIQTITPEKAKTYLEKNTNNRPIKEVMVERYALDMRKGHWLLNHQGIAFDIHGNLIDGQHRLAAIVMAGVPVQMLMTVGVPEKSQKGMSLFTMDTVDGGKKRTVGDQFNLHGTEQGNLVAACCTNIGLIVTNTHCKITTATARAIYALYKKEIASAIENKSQMPGLRAASVISAVAFAMKSDFDLIAEFYAFLIGGEGIYKTGRTSPIYSLRKAILTRNKGNGTPERQKIIRTVLNAARHFVEGNETSQLKQTTLGEEFFCARQKAYVTKVAEILSL